MGSNRRGQITDGLEGNKMSTDYHLICECCKNYSDSFTRRYANNEEDLIRFLLKHTNICSASSIKVIDSSTLFDLKNKMKEAYHYDPANDYILNRDDI